MLKHDEGLRLMKLPKGRHRVELMVMMMPRGLLLVLVRLLHLLELRTAV